MLSPLLSDKRLLAFPGTWAGDRKDRKARKMARAGEREVRAGEGGTSVLLSLCQVLSPVDLSRQYLRFSVSRDRSLYHTSHHEQA